MSNNITLALNVNVVLNSFESFANAQVLRKLEESI